MTVAYPALTSPKYATRSYFEKKSYFEKSLPNAIELQNIKYDTSISSKI